MDRALIVLTFVSALGAGLIAGVFFAFSAFVMKALARLPAASGVAAMQSINVVVINPLFLGVFLGTAAAGVAVTIAALVRWERPGAACSLIGGVLYVVGTFGVTVACNVPLNDALAEVAPDDPDVARHWRNYVTRWTAWNHLRTATALAAAGAFVLALRR